MKRIKISLLSTVCMLFFAVGAYAQDINQAIEFNNKGVEAFKAKDWNTAITQFNQALTILKELGDEGKNMTQEIKDLIPSLHYFFGQELAKASKVNEAIEQLKKAIEMADLYDDFNTTAADAKKLIDQLNIATAAAFFNEKKYEEAIAACKVVLEADPQNGNMYLSIGRSYKELGNENEAITAYEKAIELGSREAPPLLANIYLTQAQAAQRATPPKWATVYDLAKKAVAIVDNYNTNYQFGLAAVETKKFQEAIPYLDKALSSSQNDSQKEVVIYRLAMANEGLGKNSQACGFYKQLLNSSNAQLKQMAEYKIKTVLKCE